MPAVEKAAWRHRASFTSLVLRGAHLAAVLAAAAGRAPAQSGLASCTVLRSLEIHDYEGSPTQLAQLLRALPHPPALRLQYEQFSDGACSRHGPATQQLLQGPAIEAVCAALQRFHLGQSHSNISSALIPGLLAFTALTYLQLSLPKGVPLPDDISQLGFVQGRGQQCATAAMHVEHSNDQQGSSCSIELVEAAAATPWLASLCISQ